MLTNKTTLIFSILTLMCIGIMIYVSTGANTELRNNKENSLKKSSVNFIISNMNLVINEADGSTKSKIIAAKVKHSDTDSQTLLTKPNITLNQPDNNIIITADNGVIYHERRKIKHIHKIHLKDNVIITRNNHNNTTLPFIKLETESLDYLPEQDLISTDKIVHILTENSKTTANGLLFNKNLQKLQLLHHVVSSYKPTMYDNGWKITQKTLLNKQDDANS